MPTTGALLPWAANTKVRNAGDNAAITSLSTDGTSIYGTGYVFGAGGNLEGAFSADRRTGTINWIEDCHGDTYGAYATAARSTRSATRTTAATSAASRSPTRGRPTSDGRSPSPRTPPARCQHDPLGYSDWSGNPSPSMVNWFPNARCIGTYTGQGQAAWTVTGNSQYVVLGGEFPTVNGTGQQGLVRFAVKSIAPGQAGADRSPARTFMPNAVVDRAGHGPGRLPGQLGPGRHAA